MFKNQERKKRLENTKKWEILCHFACGFLKFDKIQNNFCTTCHTVTGDAINNLFLQEKTLKKNTCVQERKNQQFLKEN